MARVEMVGVSSSIRDNDIRLLTPTEQDEVIRQEADRLIDLFRTFVGGAEPVAGSDMVYQVRGPFTDPLQGVIHVHTMAAKMDLDALPRDSDAYRVHVLEADGTTQGHQLQGGEFRG